MGVPSFYRWLAKKYPNCLIDATELKPKTQDGVIVPIDTSQPNPNGREFDNLYLDMNGLIHPATHPEGGVQPKDEDEMMENICEILDRLFSIVRPRKLLYMAVDGVAPRAKMNQQRSRRFKAAQEAVENALVQERIRQELAAAGNIVPPLNSNGFDSNHITPGTAFMRKVSETIIRYAAEHLATDPGWKDVKVIISDASVPGEGEHKVMSYIRAQHSQPDYNPNTSHVICGLDADLIMLGLATHEPHFFILREEVMNKNANPNACHKCSRTGHKAIDCTEEPIPRSNLPYQFLSLAVVREYLDLEFVHLQYEHYSLERVIDDFILLCFFVGNDFLPHMPTLEIREGAIDLLMSIYKKLLPQMGYMTYGIAEMDLPKVQKLLAELAAQEDSILARRKVREEQQKRREERQNSSHQYDNRPRLQNNSRNNTQSSNRAAALSLKDSFRPAGSSSEETVKPGFKRRERDDDDDAPPSKKAKSETSGDVGEEAKKEEEVDEVRLGEEGWRDRYYKFKFGFSDSSDAKVAQICKSYVEGLCWVLKYPLQ